MNGPISLKFVIIFYINYSSIALWNSFNFSFRVQRVTFFHYSVINSIIIYIIHIWNVLPFCCSINIFPKIELFIKKYLGEILSSYFDLSFSFSVSFLLAFSSKIISFLYLFLSLLLWFFWQIKLYQYFFLYSQFFQFYFLKFD